MIQEFFQDNRKKKWMLNVLLENIKSQIEMDFKYTEEKLESILDSWHLVCPNI